MEETLRKKEVRNENHQRSSKSSSLWNAQNTRAASIKEYETLSTHIFSN